MKRKLLSILLTLCMVLTLLPTAALAEGGATPTSSNTISVTIGETITEYANQAEGWNAAVAATEAVTVKLLANWTADLSTHSFGTGKGFGNGSADGKGYILVPNSKTITLDLNDYTIDRGLQSQPSDVSEGNVFEVKGNLTLKDSGTTGKITGANISHGGGAVYVYGGGTFTMTGGSITGNKATSGTGMNGVGGVFVNGTFKMTGGSIKGNSASGNDSAGGVNMVGGSFTMTGGTITSNTGVGAGGVLFASGGAGSNNTLTVGGTAKITGNTLTGGTTASNVLLQKYSEGSGNEGVRKITCSTEMPLTSGATIGVTTQTAPAVNAPVTITGDNLSANYSSFFFSDNPLYETRNSGTGGNHVVQLLLNSDDFAGGSGTATDPYQIANADQLSRLVAMVNNKEADYATAHYQLTADIDLSTFGNWVPIGNSTNAFKGTFDGNGKTITGLSVTGGDYSGLFGWIWDATVKNLTVSGGTVSGGQSTGAIVGYAVSSTIENCHTDERVTVAGTSSDIGGIVGYLNNSTLSNSTNSAAVSSTANSVIHDVGGVVGMNSDKSTVVNCVNYGAVSITGSSYSDGVGGVVGRNTSATVTNCANYGAVTNSNVAQSGAKKITGGVVGLNEGTVSNCANSGEIKDGVSSGTLGFVGGVAGYNAMEDGKAHELLFSYSTMAPVVGSDTDNNAGTITGCGTVTDSKITLVNDYAAGVDKESSTTTYVPNAETPLTTALNSWVSGTESTPGAKFWAISSGYLAPVLFAVTFDATGGSAIPKMAATFEGKLTTLPIPTRNGYTFIGWFTVANGGEKVTLGKTYTENTTLYAHWAPIAIEDDYTPPVQTTVESGKNVNAFDLKALARESKSLTVIGKNGAKLLLDAESIKALADGSGSLNVIVSEAKGKLSSEQAAIVGANSVYELTATLNGKPITNFGGKVTVTLPYTLKSGEKAENVTVWYLATDGTLTKIPATYDAKTGLATFTVTHFSLYIVGVPEKSNNPFTDINSGNYYYDAVLWAVGKGITNGATATAFSPDGSCTRADMVTFLWRAMGSPEPKATNIFADVPANAYYSKAVMWAVEKGITLGTGKTEFSPQAIVNRSQTVTFLWRMAGNPKATATNSFTDVGADAYYANAVLWAVEKNITDGTSAKTFSPLSPCSRGQIVTFLYRYLAK